MMIFRTAKTSIDQILDDACNGLFRVVGYQHQQKAAAESDKYNRTVQVYYSSGEFSKSAGRLTGPTQHDIIFRLDLTVAAQAQGDLATLNSDAAMPYEKAIALESFMEAGKVADESLDELIDLVYQILMDPRNYDMGQTAGTVSNRWIDQVQKDQPIDRGEFFTLTASMFLRLRTAEQITGPTLVAAGDVQDVQIDLVGDDVEKTGATVNS